MNEKKTQKKKVNIILWILLIAGLVVLAAIGVNVLITSVFDKKPTTVIEPYTREVRTTEEVTLSSETTTEETLPEMTGETTPEETTPEETTFVDRVAPTVILNGRTVVYIKGGDAYYEEGATAYDETDGDLTGRISMTGNVDTSVKGVYRMNYTVSDNTGNCATASRLVFVYDEPYVDMSVNPGKKVIYLTFDDGPSEYTKKLLNVLDEYGIKATFFVTGLNPDHMKYIKEEYERGHTVALHTYVHSYATVYSNEENYFADLTRIGDTVEDMIGIRPNLIRFPGGSSNQVSLNYNIGIMTRLTEAVGMMGYRYCDWNVSSGDGAGNIPKDDIVNNVINGVQKHDVSVVLQHDSIKNSVKAVKEIIEWGLENGYTFLPMDETTPMVHHNVAN